MDKVLLIILDGFGESSKKTGNAVKLAKTPNIDALRKKYPITLLRTDSEAVGLPKRTQGGSEVGHFTIGAGRVIWQSLEEINRSIQKGDFFKLKHLLKAAKTREKFHIMGMISDEGVHSHIDHLYALLKFAKTQGLKRVYIHAITDGRDVPERSASKYIKRIQGWIKKLKLGSIATIVGRYYAMDRDTNWARTRKAYELYTEGHGIKEQSPLTALKNAYARGVKTDYYIDPIILDPKGTISNEDSVVFFNYRTDRARQITKAFAKKTFKDFKPHVRVNPYFVCFGPYSKKTPVLFPTPRIRNNLGEILSRRGLKQLRIAETEKYAHVTYFFNSQIKEPYAGEKRVLIPSPKCPSYAEKPEMSAYKVTSKLLNELGKQDFIVLNFANCDLVGHSGDLSAAIKAVETVDECVGKILPKALGKGYHVILTADHGNAEQMLYRDDSPCPSHTRNSVICVLISDKYRDAKLRKGELDDIAPTVLKIMGIKQPKDMTGESLI